MAKRTFVAINMAASNRKIPLWIYLFGLITIASSVVGIYGGYVDGTTFYSEFSADNWQNNLVKHLAGMWASKNVAIVVAMLYGFIKKDLRWLAAIFLFKFICDTPDILYVNTSFREGQAGSLMTNLLTWVILALPGLLATIVLMRRDREVTTE